MHTCFAPRLPHACMVVLNTGLAASISAWACGFDRLNSHAANGNTAGGLAHCCDMVTIIIMAVVRQFAAGLAELDGRAHRAARAAQRAQWWILDVVRRQQAPRRADQLARARCRHPTTWAPLACFLRAAGIADGAVHIWTTGNATVTPRARTQVCTSCQLLRCSAPLLTPAHWPSCLLTNCPVCSTDATSGDNCCGLVLRFGSSCTGRGGMAARSSTDRDAGVVLLSASAAEQAALAGAARSRVPTRPPHRDRTGHNPAPLPARVVAYVRKPTAMRAWGFRFP